LGKEFIVIDVVNVLMAMALGACLHMLFQWIIGDMGGMPRIPRKKDRDDTIKLEIAENTISEGPVELQESYLESLSFWQQTSDFVKIELAKTKETIDKVREVKSA
jgi:hypothetical protein